jgi:hypothetical protein
LRARFRKKLLALALFLMLAVGSFFSQVQFADQQADAGAPTILLIADGGSNQPGGGG